TRRYIGYTTKFSRHVTSTWRLLCCVRDRWRRYNQRVLSSTIFYFSKMPSNWSNDQFFVCFGQLAAKGHRSIAKDGEHIFEGVADSIRGFIKDDGASLFREAG